MAQIKRCKEPYAISIDGVTRVVTAGTLVSTDDPLYTRGTAQHFDDIDDFMTESTDRRNRATGVEEATAAPGEKRATRSGRGQKASDASVPDTQAPPTDAAADGPKVDSKS